jgi:outer membrane biosynthesis protein TonB
MKVSLTTSAIVHAAVLAAALVTIGAPEPFEVSNMETLPVELVPIEELTQIQQGDKSAPMADKSAPVPTSRPDVVPDAQNFGNNTVDVEAPPTPETKPSQNVAAAAPAQKETPAPVVDTKPNDVKDIVKEETAPPVPKEVAALPQQKPEAPSEPAEAPATEAQEEAPEEQADTQEPAEIPVPSNLPKPAARPQPPKPQETKQAQTQPAEKPSDKKPAERKQETAKSASSKESDFNADDVAALLNKQQPSGGGAKRSSDTAALGGKTNTGGSKLSQTEMDALRGLIQKNWQIIPGMADAAEVTVRVVMKLDRDGSIIGRPDVQATGGSEGTRRALSGGAYRAVMRSAPFTNLPAEKYDTWSEVIVNFNPSDLI